MFTVRKLGSSQPLGAMGAALLATGLVLAFIYFTTPSCEAPDPATTRRASFQQQKQVATAETSAGQDTSSLPRSQNPPCTSAAECRVQASCSLLKGRQNTLFRIG